ncbi:transcription factor FAMA-like isoform X2 [Cornus florida]|uniref:transcription factor FAMA-like isoform X2 n=1 Tax=Cornus florida TaxID=4283 RepID=UPI00289E90E9|nr:transcription factor FAMA-like isoform X2 [Cornus florida]XP_059651765.1 transcription factor FAMA-like isoform X2 [Cornus florida]XP_059651774.1 transcription factor FAMA-like isoform X2 [Cornus florida]XP_059651779.1 transcription factor FAMA-like isoform X2 [Cornus florida]
MEKEDNFSTVLPGSFQGLDYALDHHHHHHQQLMKPQIGETSGLKNHQIVDYMLNDPQQQHISSRFGSSIVTPLDKLSFADVNQFADFGPKLALNQPKVADEEAGIDPVYFLKFPVLNDRSQDDDDQSLMIGEDRFKGVLSVEEEEEEGEREDEEARGTSESTSVQLRNILGENRLQKNLVQGEAKNKRKRPRSMKTTEEVESQRMTHIAVERNRRKQMNEHLRVLRSLMPGSYVQRGDQASIIGGAIEFVRELEQLLQCLESQKRRRLYDDAQRSMGDSSLGGIQQPQLPSFFPSMPLENDQLKIVDLETGLHEETAETKSCFANVEVKLLGFDAMIKILSKRRPAQLIRTIAALEDLQLNILHTNITTIDQTVLYSFNVKVPNEARFTAEDIASSVQEIFSFLHANSSI